MAERLNDRLELMKRMQEAAGINIAADAPNGLMAGLRMRAAAMRCAACAHASDCEQWLDAHPDGAEKVPVFCANRELMRSG